MRYIYLSPVKLRSQPSTPENLHKVIPTRRQSWAGHTKFNYSLLIMRTTWGKTPPEVRLIILEEIAAGYPAGYAAKKRYNYTKLAQYTTVSREWQAFFEDITFRTFVIDPSHLPFFKGIFDGENIRRLGHIRHLWLRIKLDTYDCSVCRTAEDDVTVFRYVHSRHLFRFALFLTV